MELKNLSLAGSLCLVALGLFANAGVDWASATQKTAHADDLKSKRHHAVADAPMLRADEGGAEMVAMGGESSCGSIGNSQQWFGAIREPSDCFDDGGTSFGRASFSHGDVNKDGHDESFRIKDYRVVSGGQVQGCMVWLETFAVEEEEILVERTCILAAHQIHEWMQENTDWTGDYQVNSIGECGWVDIDADGDLDLWLVLWSPTTGNFQTIVLENTGFEKQAYAAGDINRDGEVDGVDISILLSDWTY
jgi:hypothetical protein